MDGAKFSARREIPEGLGDDPSPVNPQAFVIPRDGLPSRDLGHGKVAAAAPLTKGDKLGMAAQAGDMIRVKKMLKSGVDPNFQNIVSGVTPLGVASEQGHLDIARLLLTAKASTSIPTAEGARPLHIACQFGHVDIATLLLDHGAEIDVLDCRGASPFMCATSLNKLVVMELLIRRGASIDVVNLQGSQPIHLCFSSQAFDLLLDARADVNAHNAQSGHTPLH